KITKRRLLPLGFQSDRLLGNLNINPASGDRPVRSLPFFGSTPMTSRPFQPELLRMAYYKAPADFAVSPFGIPGRTEVVEKWGGPRFRTSRSLK
ncbi:MAG: hypothetical protein WCI95_13290, partial [bacterium]